METQILKPEIYRGIEEIFQKMEDTNLVPVLEKLMGDKTVIKFLKTVKGRIDIHYDGYRTDSIELTEEGMLVHNEATNPQCRKITPEEIPKYAIFLKSEGYTRESIIRKVETGMENHINVKKAEMCMPTEESLKK